MRHHVGSDLARRLPHGTEAGEQATVMGWVRAQTHHWPELGWFFAVPNGEYRSIVTARRLKEQGVRAGIPDLVLPSPRAEGTRLYHALFLEMKTQTGRVAPEQRACLEFLTSEGYCARVCWGCDAAIELLDWYLHLARPTIRMEDSVDGI